MKVYTITLRPYLETLLTSDGLISGRVNRVRCIHSRAMGGGVLVGRMLRRLRVETSAFGLLGRENAGEYLHLLGDKAGECRFLQTDGRTDERTLLRAGGARLWLEQPGTDLKRKNFDVLALALLHRLEPGDWVVLCGFTRMTQGDGGLPQELLVRFCRRVRAAGGRVAVDGVFSTLEALHASRAQLAVLSHGQLKRLTGLTPSNPMRLRTAMAMAAGGFDGRILVPCGGSTVSCLFDQRLTRGCVSHYNMNSAVSGAWDSNLAHPRILAGYAAGLSMGLDEEACLKLSCSCALPEFGRAGRWGKREILRTCERALAREWNVS